MTSIQEQIENQTKILNESQNFASEEASKKFQTIKDDMHRTNEDIHNKLGDMSKEMNEKIDNIDVEVEKLS